MFEQAGTDTSRELQSSPSPTSCSEMALRHSPTLALEEHTCHIRAKKTCPTGNLSIYVCVYIIIIFLLRTTMQNSGILTMLQTNFIDVILTVYSRPIKNVAIAEKHNGPSLFPSVHSFNVRMHNSSFTEASAPVSERNSHQGLFLVAQCDPIFIKLQLLEGGL